MLPLGDVFRQVFKNINRVIAKRDGEQQPGDREHGQQREEASLLAARPHLREVLVHQVRHLQRILRELEHHATSAAQDRRLLQLTANEGGGLGHESGHVLRRRPLSHDGLSALVVGESLLPILESLRILRILVGRQECGDLVHLFGHRHNAAADVEVALHCRADLAALGGEQPGIHAHQLRINLSTHDTSLVCPVQSLALIGGEATDLIDVDVSADILIQTDCANQLNRVLVYVTHCCATHHLHLRGDQRPHGHGVDHR